MLSAQCQVDFWSLVIRLSTEHFRLRSASNDGQELLSTCTNLPASYSPTPMSTNKNVLTDLSAYDTEALKARLSALRRYL